jgi:hypothetical protein
MAKRTADNSQTFPASSSTPSPTPSIRPTPHRSPTARPAPSPTPAPAPTRLPVYVPQREVVYVTPAPTPKPKPSLKPTASPTPSPLMPALRITGTSVEFESGQARFLATIDYANDSDDGEVLTCGAFGAVPSDGVDKLVEATRNIVNLGKRGCTFWGKIRHNGIGQFRLHTDPLTPVQVEFWQAHRTIFIFGGQIVLRNANGRYEEEYCGMATAGVPGAVLCPVAPP